MEEFADPPCFRRFTEGPDLLGYRIDADDD